MGIIDPGQIVGISYGAGFSHPRGVIWLNRKAYDLNGMVSNGSTMVLNDAQEINDRGEITGQGTAPDGSFPAFFLVPEGDDR